MKSRFSLTQTTLCAFALASLSVAACGGRYQTGREVFDDAAGSGGSAPSAGRGGSVSSSAGSSMGGAGIAGSSSGGTSSGGTSSAGAASSGGGGGGNCIFGKCTNPVKCLGGQDVVVEPGQCCPTRCGACPHCPMLTCPAGYHLETAASDCCPHCSPDGNVGFCEKGKQEYAVLRKEFLNKYSYGCASSSECAVIAPVNSCEQGCSYAVVWYGVADSFEANLSNAAAANCSSCMQGPIPPCVPPPMPRCVNGQCSL